MATGSPSLTHGFLFADLRGYTAFVEAKGDVAAAQLLRTYRSLVRECVAAADGAEIRTEGDSFYIVFPSASGAILCALDIVDAVAAEAGRPGGAPIRVGIGVHAGEAAEDDEGYVGSAVNLAARVCAQAGPGEVMVTDTVRALTRTRLDVHFESRGQRRLKGIEEPVGLYTVERGHASDRRVGAIPPTRRRGVVAATVGVVAVAALLLVIVIVLRPSQPAAPGAAGSGSPGAGSVAAMVSPPAVVVGPSPGAASMAPPTQVIARASPLDPGQVGFPTTDEQALLDRIPKEVRSSCRRALPRDGAQGAISFICVLPLTADADVVRWDVFDSPSQLDLAYSRITTQHDLGKGDCATDGSATMAITEYYDLRVACYQDAGTAYIAWTYGGVNALLPILGRAQRSGGDGAALFEWWKLVGPFLY